MVCRMRGAECGVLLPHPAIHTPLAIFLPHVLPRSTVPQWHLGMSSWRFTPLERGFDSYYGYLGGGEDYCMLAGLIVASS